MASLVMIVMKEGLSLRATLGRGGWRKCADACAARHLRAASSPVPEIFSAYVFASGCRVVARHALDDSEMSC